MATVTDSFDGILAGLQADLSPQAAEGILTLGFSVAQKERMTELAARARAGQLSEDEQAEASNYEHVSSLLGILQSRARMSLKHSAS